MNRRVFVREGALALVTLGLSPSFLRRTAFGMPLLLHGEVFDLDPGLLRSGPVPGGERLPAPIPYDPDDLTATIEAVVGPGVAAAEPDGELLTQARAATLHLADGIGEARHIHRPCARRRPR